MAEDYEKYIGTKFKGEKNIEYTITALCSNEGGNGYVFNCETNDKSVFAVKVLHNHGKGNVKLENFKKEISLLKALKSPYIVKCIDSGTLRAKGQQNDRHFFVMKKYNKTLEQMINSNEITANDAFHYSIQLCYALKAMHKRSEPLIHRDLKPDNILFDEDQRTVVLCDLGLTHISNNNNKTINKGFVGNNDYHAPEQKKRGHHEVGTYTDIYSLGLIFNVLFTKEIPSGVNYKRIMECAPYFCFIDELVDRMIEHDIAKRESDINAVLMVLNRHDMEFEIDESFLKPKLSKFSLSSNQIKKIMDLYALSTSFLRNDFSSKNVNQNYYGHYLFSCIDTMRNYLLLCILYKNLKRMFESEKFNPDLYLNYNNSADKTIIDDFNKSIDVPTYTDASYLKDTIKKFFQSIYNYHAREVLKSIPKIKEKIDSFCLNVPILIIIFFVKENIVDLGLLHSSNFIVFSKKEASKKGYNVLFIEANPEFNVFKYKISSLFKGASFIVNRNSITVFFDNDQKESRFEELLKKLINNLPSGDIRREDINDIIDNAEVETITKLYTFDISAVNTVLNKLAYIV